MIIGAPIIGVTAFNGKRLLLPGIIVSILQSIAIHAPLKIVIGTRCLWLDVPSTILATCGTANPIKDTGPQNAVIAAVRIPVQRRIESLALFILTPKLAAYISPSNNALRGFISSTAYTRPIIVKVAKYGSFSIDTLVKSPIPHITY